MDCPCPFRVKSNTFASSCILGSDSSQTISLWAKGVRYRKNDKSVFGKPDLTIKKYKIAIFVDSEYFHGKDWDTDKYRIKSNREFWWNKIEANQMRDQIVNSFLVDKEWKVLRFWSKEIRKNWNLCTDEIIAVINERKDV